jgi:hypothetical protein
MTYNLSIVNDKLPINSFQKRIDDFKETEFHLRKIEKYNCLVSVKKADGVYEYHINNGIIILKKRIGSKSRYGVIYLTTTKFNKRKFATKLTVANDYNYNEIVIASNLSKISLRNLSPHFLFIYKSFYCNNNTDKYIPELIKRNNLLKESDIKVMSDKWEEMDIEAKSLWTNYRKQLRDIPQLFSNCLPVEKSSVAPLISLIQPPASIKITYPAA